MTSRNGAREGTMRSESRDRFIVGACRDRRSKLKLTRSNKLPGRLSTDKSGSSVSVNRTLGDADDVGTYKWRTMMRETSEKRKEGRDALQTASDTRVGRIVLVRRIGDPDSGEAARIHAALPRCIPPPNVK